MSKQAFILYNHPITSGETKLSDRMRVDFHNHTHYSPDSLTSASELLKAAGRAGLDKIAVTDHNSIGGALEAYSLAPDLVIVGEEVLTTKGEILALFVKEFVPPRLSPSETIRRLREQGAFISISHPFDPFRSGWSLQDLEEMVPDLDAVEVFNSHCFTRRMNEQAAHFARQHGLAGTAGSDAHWPMEVGNGFLTLPPFNNAAELRSVIRQANVQGKRSSSWLRFLSPYVHIRKKFGWG